MSLNYERIAKILGGTMRPLRAAPAFGAFGGRTLCRGICLSIPLKTVNELNDHSYYRNRQRRAKRQRQVVGMEFMRQGHRSLAHLFPCRIKFTRIAPGNGLDPGDGLPSAFKFIRDAVCEIIGVDDRSPLYQWAYDQRRGKPKEYGVEIEIEPLADAGGKA